MTLVFLRVLEYYEGILFLTTNRVGAVDEAFKSRIHMPLFYPWLDQDQTYKIWRSQLHRVKDYAGGMIEFDEFELLGYATTLFTTQAGLAKSGPRWNGRQIRNAFQSAIAIAECGISKGEPATLGVSHFQKVVKASDAFDDYLRRTKNGLTDADIASTGMMRDDTYGLQANPSNMTQQQGFHQNASNHRLSFRRGPQSPMNAPFMQPTSQHQGYQTLAPPQQYQPQPNMQPYQQQPNTFALNPTPQQWPSGNSQDAAALQAPPQQQQSYAVQQHLAPTAVHMQQPPSGAPDQQQLGAYQPPQAIQAQAAQNLQPQGQGQQAFGVEGNGYGYK